MDFSVITPVYNNPEQLEIFLDALQVSMRSYNGKTEVIVVDDHSSADFAPVLAKYPDVIFLRLPENAGPAAARTQGAARASGDYLLFFDSDVAPHPDTLEKFSRDFARGEEAVAGEYDIKPLSDSFFAQFKALLTESWTPRTDYVSVFALRAAGIKKDIFNKAGGFDSNIKTASVEDFEFGNRLKRIGARIYYDPDILVKHHHPVFFKQMKLFFLRSMDWSKLFLERHGRFDNWCASPGEGAASLAGTLLVLSAPLAFALTARATCALAGSLLLAYIFFNRHFIAVVYKRKGPGFVPVALAIKLPLSFMITAGFFIGVLKFIAASFKSKLPARVRT